MHEKFYPLNATIEAYLKQSQRIIQNIDRAMNGNVL